MTTKIVIILIKALIEICVTSMKYIEEHSVKDPDGLPIDSEYDKLGYFLASFRDTLKTFEDETENN